MKLSSKHTRKFHIQNGFTLIELVIVVVLLGILSIATVYKFSSGTHTQFKYETIINKIATDIRYAQQLAMSEGEGTRIYFDQPQNRYYLTWDDGTNIQNPLGGEYFTVQMGQGDFQGVQITSTAFTNGRLDFNTAGRPLNNGADFSGTLNVVTLNNTKQIIIRANTGLLTIQDL